MLVDHTEIEDQLPEEADLTTVDYDNKEVLYAIAGEQKSADFELHFEVTGVEEN